MKNEIAKLMYTSLEKKYQSQVDEMKATLMIYFENPVGIGEHPQHLEEMDKILEKLSAAEDKLQNLKKFANYSINI
jgi:hypothetical protein